MTHQIPPHLAFCTPGENEKAKQGTNLETFKKDKQKTQQYVNAPYIDFLQTRCNININMDVMMQQIGQGYFMI